MRFSFFCGIASATDRHPDGFTPITNGAAGKTVAAGGKLLDTHYDGASFPAAVAAGAITAARAEPQNRQRVLLCYQRRVPRRCTSSNNEVKAALTDVAELLHQYAEVHHALQMPEHGIRTDASAYLRNLCLSIRRSKLEPMKIDLALAARRLRLPSDRCWLLGMIVYELITNAARHAFAGSNGWIRVESLRSGALVECRVLDNGSAPVSFRPGRGLKIVGELTKALERRFDQRFATGGSTSIVVFPSSSEPQVPANRRTGAAAMWT